MLIEAIPAEKQKDIRKHEYFILGHLLEKYHNDDVVQFIIDRLPAEKDKYILSFMLKYLSHLEKSDRIRIDNLLECSRDSRWQVRQPAIQALAHCHHPGAQERLLEVMQLTDQKKNKHDIIYAILAFPKEKKNHDDLLEGLSKSKIKDIREICKKIVADIQTE